MAVSLLNTAARLIAGPAAPQIAAKLTNAVSQQLNAPAIREQQRRRLLIWLSGTFRAEHPDAYDALWTRLNDAQHTPRGRDGVLDALAVVANELNHAEHPEHARCDWFRQLSDSSPDNFNALIDAIAPAPTNSDDIADQLSIHARNAGQTARRQADQALKRFRKFRANR